MDELGITEPFVLSGLSMGGYIVLAFARKYPEMLRGLILADTRADADSSEAKANRDKAVTIAAGRSFFNQDPNILRFVMENPTDRVTYGDMRMIRAEFDDLMQLSVEAGTLGQPIGYEKYVDETFARRAVAASIAL